MKRNEIAMDADVTATKSYQLKILFKEGGI